jgi:hypothetical protein
MVKFYFSQTRQALIINSMIILSRYHQAADYM